jgi:hypothetical protein
MSNICSGVELSNILAGKYDNPGNSYSHFYNHADKKVPTISFDGVTFVNECKVTNVVCNYRLIFYRCEFQSDLRFSKTTFKFICQILDSKYPVLSIHNCIGLHLEIRAKDSKITSLKTCRFNKIGLLAGSGSFTLTKIFSEELVIKGINSKKLNFSGDTSFVSRLIIQGDIEKGNHYFNNINTNIISIESTVFTEAKLNFNSIITSRWCLSDFVNKGQFVVNDILYKPGSSIFKENLTLPNAKKLIQNFNNFPKKKETNSQEVKLSNLSLKTEDIIVNQEDEFIEFSFDYIVNFNESNYEYFDVIYESGLSKQKKIPKKFDSAFVIENSHLGNSIFRNIPFEKFKALIIEKTDLSTILTFNATFVNSNLEGTHSSLYETYNNLYTLAKKKNNKYEEITYYKITQFALLKTLHTEKKKSSIPSIISLNTSLFYSSFGTSWTQALLVTISIGAVFYIFAVLGTKLKIDISPQGINNFYSGWKYFLQFLNPTHKIDFMDNFLNIQYSNYNFFVTFDLLGRIFISIGIFETIRSFRKFVRK